jgi:hypothetical protein
MKKKDFTAEHVGPEVFEYITNQEFPHDALDEIGSKVFITDLADVEIKSVKQSGNFIVDGSGTVEIEADRGEGDTFEKGFPTKFRYEFDEDGKIVRQHKFSIDTSSYFGEDTE